MSPSPCLIPLLASCLHAAAVPDAIVPERDGLVAWEAEDPPGGGGWLRDTALPGASGGACLRNQDDAKKPGSDPLIFACRIATAGVYQVQVRSRIAAGTNSTEANDSFIRLEDAAGTPVEPVPNRNVATDGWYKFYLNITGAWSWNTSNRDRDPRALAWDLAAGAVYRLHISRRSKGHALDRIVLWNRARHDLGRDRGHVNASQATRLDAVITIPGKSR